jgi:HAD domain in Swiss Army Knife RNA repair proteins
MTILLDIDGVLVTTPSWQIPDRLDDGFMQFNVTAAQNLLVLYEKTNADIVLTTTHRINYTIEQWHDIFKLRGFDFKNISKINDKTSIETLGNRATEI